MQAYTLINILYMYMYVLYVCTFVCLCDVVCTYLCIYTCMYLIKLKFMEASGHVKHCITQLSMTCSVEDDVYYSKFSYRLVDCVQCRLSQSSHWAGCQLTLQAVSEYPGILWYMQH